MAKQRVLFTLVIAICYLTGETWADTPTLTNVSSSSNSSSSNNNNNNNSTSTSTNNSNGTGININSSPVQVPAKSTEATKVSSPAVVAANTTAAPKCVCDGALLPRLSENGKELEICPDCKCKHEARNTTLIKVVVIIVIWIISILVIYMLFLMCLDPLLNKRVKANYQEHTNEDDETTAASPPLPTIGNQELNARANVLNRVGHQQDKWKRQVREQRRHIYDRRTMLN